MKQRGSQDGSLVVKGKSMYAYFRRHVVVDGNVLYKPTSKRIGPANMPEKKAKAELRKLVDEANALAAAPRMMATVRQFVDAHWWPERVLRRRPSTQAFYRNLLDNHILPSLGNLPLKNVTPGVVQTLLDAKAELLDKEGRQVYSKRTIVGIRDAITGIYRLALRRGYWDGNIPSVGGECGGKEAREERALTSIEASMVIQHVTPLYRPLISLLRYTGLRIGEALGLRWRAVNLTDEDIVVDQVVIPAHCIALMETYHPTHGWGRPKTKHSHRIVPLTAHARKALETMRELDILGVAEDPVFRSRNGGPWKAHGIAKRHLKPAGKLAGVPWVHFHSFRHSLTEVDMETRRKALGHSSAQQTDRYTHPDLEETRRQMEMVGQNKPVVQ